LVLATLEGESARPAELARRCGVTRQTMQQAVAGLTASDVVAVGPEPTDSRGRRVTLAPRGHDLLEDARNHLERLERLLEERLGRDTVDVLREALTQEWGDPKLTEDAPAAQPNTSVASTIV
jgi:DNA-binding MarR family transcriptional regulator